jgi:hypothetical protein
MTNVLIRPSPEEVQAQFEQAEKYWKRARVATEKAERAAYEDMARECIASVRPALH